MSKVIPFDPKRKSTSKSCAGARSDVGPKQPTLIEEIKNAASELVIAVEELERDGYQEGSDAIGHYLAELDRLHGLWCTVNSLPGYDPINDIPW